MLQRDCFCFSILYITLSQLSKICPYLHSDAFLLSVSFVTSMTAAGFKTICVLSWACSSASAITDIYNMNHDSRYCVKTNKTQTNAAFYISVNTSAMVSIRSIHPRYVCACNGNTTSIYKFALYSFTMYSLTNMAQNWMYVYSSLTPKNNHNGIDKKIIVYVNTNYFLCILWNSAVFLSSSS